MWIVRGTDGWGVAGDDNEGCGGAWLCGDDEEEKRLVGTLSVELAVFTPSIVTKGREPQWDQMEYTWRSKSTR